MKPNQKQVRNRQIAQIRRYFKNTKLIIIDEVSMVSCKLLNTVDIILKQIAENDKPFGNFHIVCCGDFLQLPSVASVPLSREISKIKKK